MNRGALLLGIKKVLNTVLTRLLPLARQQVGIKLEHRVSLSGFLHAGANGVELLYDV
jgi:hypothetical protein